MDDSDNAYCDETPRRAVFITQHLAKNCTQFRQGARTLFPTNTNLLYLTDGEIRVLFFVTYGH